MGLRLFLTWLTLRALFRSYPRRILRFVLHFFQWIPSVRKYHLHSTGLTEWMMDLLFYTADLLLFPDISESIISWLQSDLRMLTNEEKSLASFYFGKNVNFQNVRVCYRMPRRIQQVAMAFVSFNTIHYSKTIPTSVLMHELVHVWQYQKFGSVYIYRALKAQKKFECYDYGGPENLYSEMLANKKFVDFNFEQQGKIFEDYCRLRESQDLDQPLVMASFEYFVSQVRDDRKS